MIVSNNKQVVGIFVNDNIVIQGVLNNEIIYDLDISVDGPTEVNTYDYGEYMINMGGEELLPSNILCVSDSNNYEVFNNTVTFYKNGVYDIILKYKIYDLHYTVNVTDIEFQII